MFLLEAHLVVVKASLGTRVCPGTGSPGSPNTVSGCPLPVPLRWSAHNHQQLAQDLPLAVPCPAPSLAGRVLPIWFKAQAPASDCRSALGRAPKQVGLSQLNADQVDIGGFKLPGTACRADGHFGCLSLAVRFTTYARYVCRLAGVCFVSFRYYGCSASGSGHWCAK